MEWKIYFFLLAKFPQLTRYFSNDIFVFKSLLLQIHECTSLSSNWCPTPTIIFERRSFKCDFVRSRERHVFLQEKNRHKYTRLGIIGNKEARSCYFQSYKFFLLLQEFTFSILIWNSKKNWGSSTFFAHFAHSAEGCA